IGSLADEHGLLDDVFSKTFPTIIDKKPVTNMTIKMQGDAWYVDGIDVNDLPKVRKQHIFRVRPGQQAGTLLSAQSNPFLNRIHNYLRGKEKVRRCSLKTTQLITAQLKNKKISITKAVPALGNLGFLQLPEN